MLRWCPIGPLCRTGPGSRGSARQAVSTIAMNETRQSLLFRAQRGEENAWKDLTDLYRPLIIGWLNRQGVPGGDLEDLTQDVLLTVIKHLPAFEHSGRRGAFRA